MLGRGGGVVWEVGSPIGHGTESDSVESNSGKVRCSVDLVTGTKTVTLVVKKMKLMCVC